MLKLKLEDLNLLDDFLFGKMASHPTIGPIFCKSILQVILNQNIGEIQIVPQKVYFGADTDKHGIRIDVFVEETDDSDSGTIYDIEPDKNDKESQKESLPKRIRFYHAKIDENSLQSGDDYSHLKRVVIIMITPYDPFNLNRMVYTIKNCCVEEPDMPYDDGAMTIYLYTKGTKGNPRKELQELLHYMENSKENIADSTLLKDLHHMVEHVKHDKEVSLEYMKIFEREKMLHDDGQAEGMNDFIEVIRKKVAKNMSVSDIAELLEKDEASISRLVKLIETHPDDSNFQIADRYLANID